MCGSIFSFMAMTVAGRELAGQLDVYEMLFYRAVIGVVIVVAVMLATGQGQAWKGSQTRLHITRSSLHYLGQVMWFQALLLIPIAQLFALEFTAPLWVVLFAPLFLGERLTKPKLLAAVVGFVGVLSVAKPDFSQLNSGVLLAAGSAVFFAINVMMTRKLTAKEGVIGIMFWQVAVQAMLGTVVTGWDLSIAVPQGWGLVWMLLVGLCGLFAHYCLTRALRLAPVSIVFPMDFVRLPMAAVMGWFLYNEALELAVLAGAALILLGNWMNIRYGAEEGPRGG